MCLLTEGCQWRDHYGRTGLSSGRKGMSGGVTGTDSNSSHILVGTNSHSSFPTGTHPDSWFLFSPSPSPWTRTECLLCSICGGTLRNQFSVWKRLGQRNSLGSDYYDYEGRPQGPSYLTDPPYYYHYYWGIASDYKHPELVFVIRKRTTEVSPRVSLPRRTPPRPLRLVDSPHRKDVVTFSTCHYYTRTGDPLRCVSPCSKSIWTAPSPTPRLSVSLFSDSTLGESEWRKSQRMKKGGSEKVGKSK